MPVIYRRKPLSEYTKEKIRLSHLRSHRSKRRSFGEYRHIMEKLLGRKLTRKEVVHHIDGNCLNNNPDNLKLMSLSEHIKHHRPFDKIQGKPKLSKLQIEEVIKRRGENASIIAEDYGVKQGTIFGIWRKNKLGHEYYIKKGNEFLKKHIKKVHTLEEIYATKIRKREYCKKYYQEHKEQERGKRRERWRKFKK